MRLSLLGTIRRYETALWFGKSIKVARTLKKLSLNPIIVAKTSPQPAICKLYVLYLFFLILVNEIIKFACLSLAFFSSF